MDNKTKGNFGEFLARMMFRFKGYRIIAQNYVTGRGTTAGEIDFIATRGRTIVFVEVKNRLSMDKALYAITYVQQKRLKNAAKLYLSQHPNYLNHDVRFDAVFVSNLKIRHMQNAF